MTQRSGVEKTRTTVRAAICRLYSVGGTGAPGRARRHQRIGRTTGDRRQRGFSLEPGRGDHADRVPAAERRCSTCVPDQHGHRAGRRVRRGQRDRPEAPSAISPQEAHGRQGVGRRCRRNGRVRRALGARLDGTRASVRSRVAPDSWTRSPRSTRPRSVRSARRVQEAGHRDRARGGQGHARRAGWATDGSGRLSGCRTPALGHWQPLINRDGAADPRSDPMGRRREAVPHPELVAVPQRATARARQRAMGG